MSDIINHNTESCSKKKYFCDMCGSEFNLKSILTRHIIWHMKIKPYRCQICDSKFSNSYTLKRHYLIHSNTKPYVCTICEKSYRDSSNFRKHQLRHLNVKYECSHCGRQFLCKSYLKSHMKIHSKFKTWDCFVCHVKFYTKKDKKRHEATHSGEKHYTCNMCYASFGRKDNLDRHIRNTHALFRCQDDKIRIDEENNGSEATIANTSEQHSIDNSKVCNNNCLLHIRENSDETFGNNENSSMKTKNDSKNENVNETLWLKIVEANNKRESVIFKFKSDCEMKISNCHISEASSKDLSFENNGSQNMDSNINDNNNKHTLDEHLLKNYKQNYNVNKNKSESKEEFSVDYVKFDTYYNQLSSQNPNTKIDKSESIELYKRILFPKYKFKKSLDIPKNELSLENVGYLNKNVHSSNFHESESIAKVGIINNDNVILKESDSNSSRRQSDSDASSSVDIHWRRRLAQISNNEKKIAME